MLLLRCLYVQQYAVKFVATTFLALWTPLSGCSCAGSVCYVIFVDPPFGFDAQQIELFTGSLGLEVCKTIVWWLGLESHGGFLRLSCSLKISLKICCAAPFYLHNKLAGAQLAFKGCSCSLFPSLYWLRSLRLRLFT